MKTKVHLIKRNNLKKEIIPGHMGVSIGYPGNHTANKIK